MKHVSKFLLLAASGAVLLAALHTHINAHAVSHPKVAKVSQAKHGVPPLQLLVAPANVAVQATEHLTAMGSVAALGTVLILLKSQPSFCPLRGPPLIAFL